MPTKRSDAGAMDEYLQVIQKTLNAALCITNFESMQVDGHNIPIVETQDHLFKELKATPIKINRDADRQILIEPTINSVRISYKIKDNNETEKLLIKNYGIFLQRRANELKVIRKKSAHEGYDVSFLITNFHLEKMVKEQLIDFIVDFVDGIDAEIKNLRLVLGNRTREVARNFLGSFL